MLNKGELRKLLEFKKDKRQLLRDALEESMLDTEVINGFFQSTQHINYGAFVEEYVRNIRMAISRIVDDLDKRGAIK